MSFFTTEPCKLNTVYSTGLGKREIENEGRREGRRERREYLGNRRPGRSACREFQEVQRKEQGQVLSFF
jgi:hypothetical protein